MFFADNMKHINEACISWSIDKHNKGLNTRMCLDIIHQCYFFDLHQRDSSFWVHIGSIRLLVKFKIKIWYHASMNSKLDYQWNLFQFNKRTRNQENIYQLLSNHFIAERNIRTIVLKVKAERIKCSTVVTIHMDK